MLPRRPTLLLLPTRYCFILGAVMVSIFFAALHYENNLAYLVLALIVSMTAVSAIHTYRNLLEIDIDPTPIVPVFVEEAVIFPLQVHNRKGTDCYSLLFDLPMSRLIERPTPLSKLSGHNTHLLELKLEAHQRGKHSLSELHISSSYPFGLFRVSFRIPLKVDYLVYPKPEHLRPWKEKREESILGEQTPDPSGDDFYGWKNYRHGDSLHHVNWKAFARGRPLLVQDYAGNHIPLLSLTWDELEGLDEETRLSQMASWVLQAHQQGIPYELQLPGTKIPIGQGTPHFHQCLRALALYS